MKAENSSDTYPKKIIMLIKGVPIPNYEYCFLLICTNFTSSYKPGRGWTRWGGRVAAGWAWRSTRWGWRRYRWWWGAGH